MKSFEPAQYEQLWQALVAEQPESSLEYFTYHKQRYAELFAAVATYLAGSPTQRLLEVGVSGFLPFYKQLFPNLQLVTIDRPIALHGVNADYSLGVGAEAHYSFDLNEVVLSPEVGSPPLGHFDLVICTEVIEHLLVHPSEFIASLLSLLSPTGYLYLTTPNFFSYHRLNALLHGKHPMPVHPQRGQNQDHGHHFREYTLPELCSFTQEAGGTVAAAYFSCCWDDAYVRTAIVPSYPELAGNLVLVAARQSFADIQQGPKLEPRPFHALMHLFPNATYRARLWHIAHRVRQRFNW
jgi:SAM-dependent methyltransferase